MSHDITDEVWEAEGDRDRGVIWGAVDDITLEECDAALSHLDEEGFVYYLPAFLRLAVRQLASGYSDRSRCFSGVVFHLTHVSSNYALAKLKRLTDPEIDVVIAFLRAVRDRRGLDAEDAVAALMSYWETPESRRRTLIHVP